MQLLVHESSDELKQIEDKSGTPSLTCGSTSCLGSSESPLVFPRIGDKYQAEVPPFEPPRDCCKQDRNGSMNNEKSQDVDYEELFAEGLPVPLMQVPCFSPIVDVKVSDMNHSSGPFLDNALGTKELPVATTKMDSGLRQHGSLELEDRRCVQQLNFNGSIQFTQDNGDSSLAEIKGEFSRAEGELESDCMDSIVALDSMPDALSSGRGRRRRRGQGGWKRVKKAKADSLKLEKQRPDLNGHTHHSQWCTMGGDVNSRRYIMVPGSPSEPWTEIEEDVFILGLYIFGKNFVAVKRFLETKKMEDILSHYYGKFFRTETYCRWAESRKIRSRKCFQGQRIFSGWRQQELSTRLLPHVPEHLKHKVPETMKAFSEGRISIEEFVTELKALVGLKMLVQAVGIGKGNHDLTAAVMEPLKTNQVASTRFEIPMGRACSSLSTEDIVKFLTGDYRISKARANDLFWEAVWPRLLARGWHSEQPEDQASFGFRPLLVFLIPGVQKFSRRILVKGVHYFDSVSEVLSRVASEPRLLDPPPELEVSEALGKTVKPDCLWTAEIPEGQNDWSSNPPCYLRPKYSTNELESFIFTVVDTSLVSQGEEPARFRESRALPADDSSECLQSDSGEIEDGDDSVLLPNKKVEIGESLAIRDKLNSDADDTAHLVISNENLGGFNRVSGIFMSSPPYGSPCPSSQSQHKDHCSRDLMLQISCSSSFPETGTSEDRTWELNRVGCSYGAFNPNSDVVNYVAQCRQTPSSWDYLCFPLKQRSLSLHNYAEGETRDGQMIQSSETKEHGLALSSILVKFDAKEETPTTFLGSGTSESSIYIPCSIQVSQAKSGRDFSALLCGSWFSFNRISNDALYSRLCRLKPWTVPQDHSGNLILKSIPVIGAALLEVPKLMENSQSEQDSGHAQELPKNSGEAQSSRTDPNLKALKSEGNSPPKQDFGHPQELPNDSGQTQSASLVPLLDVPTYGENSQFEEDSGHHQGQANNSGQTHSTISGPYKGKPVGPQENNDHGLPTEVRRQSTRIRPLTTRALEAFACGFYTPRRRKGGRSIANSDSSHSRSHSRQVPDDPAYLLNGSSLDNNNITVVDTSMESMEGEENSDVQLSAKSRRGYKRRRRTHALMKIPKAGLYPENLGQEKREDVVTGMLVSEVGN